MALSSDELSSGLGISDVDLSFLTPPKGPQLELSSQYTTPQPLAIKRLREIKGSCTSPALTVPTSPMMKRLGYGTGVGVYLLQRSPKPCGEIRSPWAIKKINKLKLHSDSKTYQTRLEYEASVLKKLNHPNIVGYRGFSNGVQPVLAMESASSSLGDLVEARVEEELRPTPFPASSIEKVALGVARALDYLHEEMQMIHGDLKSGNVLVFGEFKTVKLCDFGVSKQLKADGTLGKDSYVGTQIWNPMEVILAQNDTPKWPITKKADMYPFGLTIFEMIALRHPHLPEEGDEEEEEYYDSNTDTISADGSLSSLSFDELAYEEKLAKHLGTRPPLPEFDFDASYNKVLEAFYVCTEEDPMKRPSAEDIITLISLKLN